MDLPLRGRLVSDIFCLVTLGVLAICLTRRIQRITKWNSLPFANCLTIAVYVDSMFLVGMIDIMLQGVGVSRSRAVCEATTLISLICYFSARVLIYLFFVEIVHIIMYGGRKPRATSKLWIFNVCMLVPYVCVIVPTLASGVSRLDNHGSCMVNIQRPALISFTTFDAVVNTYLGTIIAMYLVSIGSKTGSTPTHRALIYRSFLGSLATLASSASNLTVLILVKQEPAWIFYICCIGNALFSVLALHWISAMIGGWKNSYPGSRTDRGQVNITGSSIGKSKQNAGHIPLAPIDSRVGRFTEPADTNKYSITISAGGQVLKRDDKDDNFGASSVGIQRSSTQQTTDPQREINSAARVYHTYGLGESVSANSIV